MHALRLPMGALTAGLASLSYAQYKVTGIIHIPGESCRSQDCTMRSIPVIILIHAACYLCVSCDRTLKQRK
ncbi:hypothetical protein K457DRAFT_135482 [Linnemannia elongata AG-77]|uniref:Uncharacterized protein n=1 Tax=Linnemannia elongata AG-77 TaxID=1314771 RepID=A0A197K3U5_9FUNG|nr:hypothetical protein K457DRAFT_135482 [Linnemannia elongata AG-77]